MVNSIEVLLISGSIRHPSYTSTLTQSITNKLIQHGNVTQYWDLREKPLPIADPKFHRNPADHHDKTVQQFVRYATFCDAFILASPIYHNSFSGVLKNALDHLSVEQFCYKPVGLISHGGNRSPQAVDHLRIVVRGLLGVAIPTQVCTTSQDYREVGVEGYELASEDILRRIERFTSELEIFAHQFCSIRKRIL